MFKINLALRITSIQIRTVLGSNAITTSIQIGMSKMKAPSGFTV